MSKLNIRLRPIPKIWYWYWKSDTNIAKPIPILQNRYQFCKTSSNIAKLIPILQLILPDKSALKIQFNWQICTGHSFYLTNLHWKFYSPAFFCFVLNYLLRNWEELVMNCHDWVTSRFRTDPGSWSTLNTCRIFIK